MAQYKIQLTWLETNFTWNEIPFTWNDVYKFVEFLDQFKAFGGSPTHLIKQLPEEDRRRIIKLICQVAGYKPTEYEKEVIKTENDKVFVSDIQIAARKILNVEITAIEITS
mgnify:CR=1 FL=1